MLRAVVVVMWIASGCEGSEAERTNSSRAGSGEMTVAAATKSAGWWCVGDAYCHRDREVCASLRMEIGGGKDMSGDCTPSFWAACFEMYVKRLAGTMSSCHPTMEGCRGQLHYVRIARVGEAQPLNECHMMD